MKEAADMGPAGRAGKRKQEVGREGEAAGKEADRQTDERECYLGTAPK